MSDAPKNALLIAAAFICAVRLAMEELKNTPRVVAAISDSIWLAEKIWNRIDDGRR